MSKSFKVAALVAVTAMFLAAPVFVQPVYAQESNTSKATAGVFTSDVDDSQDVHFYTGVEFDKWFGFIGYGGSVTTNPVSLGYATRFGDLYLGTWYSGNVVRIRENWTEEVVTDYDPNSQIKTGSSETTTTYPYDNSGIANTISSNNEIGVLIGVAGMGIKVGFAESVTERTFPNNYNNSKIVATNNGDGTISYDSGIVEHSDVSGKLSPSLQWGMSLEAGDVTIRPKVTLGVDIGLSNRVYDTRGAYTTADGKVLGTDTITRSGRSADAITPYFEVGAGIDLDGYSIDFSYGLDIGIYSNSYDASGIGGSTLGTVSWSGSTATTTTIATTDTQKTANLNINDQSFLNHSVHLGYYTDKEIASGLKLGLYAGADVGINTSTSDQYTLGLTSNKTVYNNAALSTNNTGSESEARGPSTVETETELTIEPFVNIGASYELIPGRFTVNAGIALRPLAYTNTVTRTSETSGKTVTKTKSLNHRGEVTSETVSVSGGGDSTTDSVEVDNTWDYFRAGLFGGFVFNFNDNLALDLSTGGYITSDVGNQNFTTNIANLNVLFTFKF
jgi:hypothetical protein